jgi:ribosomal protein S18 acetylase RimI-like enzyme
MGTRFERAVALLKHVELAAATHTERWSGGTAFFNSDYPKKYAQNFLRLDEDAELSVEEIVAEADRIQGGAGLTHRRVNGLTPNLQELAAGFKERGWEVVELVVMAHDGNLRPPAKAVPVEQVDLATIRPVMIAWDLEVSNFTHDMAEHLADSRIPLEKAGLVTFFQMRLDDTVAGWCELWRFEGVAQVENVMTFPAFRGRGVASAGVTRALEVAYEDSAEMAFIVADNNDWPKELYARLGFEPVGHMWEFTLAPSA